MKSFRQYILEVATDTPKDIKFEHEKEDRSKKTGFIKFEHEKEDLDVTGKEKHAFHTYHIQHPNGRNYKVTMNTRVDDGYKSSVVNFADTHGYTTRTGAQGVKRASKVLSQVHHVIKHHIKNESPDKIMFVADKDEKGGQNPSARHDIYRKMGERSADKLGYEHAPDIDKGGITQHYVKKKKK